MCMLSTRRLFVRMYYRRTWQCPVKSPERVWLLACLSTNIQESSVLKFNLLIYKRPASVSLNSWCDWTSYWTNVRSRSKTLWAKQASSSRVYMVSMLQQIRFTVEKWMNIYMQMCPIPHPNSDKCEKVKKIKWERWKLREASRHKLTEWRKVWGREG